ncbi:glycosyltransferase family 2 protein [Lacrimispora sp. 210928-DFI.3.58]|uniref:glycosyltransferase family 2 protein n=1 Tax=Lacrimispora sp. 210928-DFI.3.58 TaxID=2883214 RepID=UPI0015B72993|nr:glycosyltransferase family 2 protein [Lacrimispora sp. 210928-DFI.3.58]MCB7320961.1 glycosyltransferase [Lacrimispora sp. 210928-DFI.3.58]
MDRIKVSIVTVCRNSEAVIRQTMDSVLQQTYDNIEYIIIDGLSEDSTVAIAESYRTKFEKRGYSFRILSEADKGIYDAMNKGISLTTGELVGLINSGDWYEEQTVEKVVDTYIRTAFDVFYADIRIWRESGAVIKKARLRRYATTRDWNHPTTFIRRRLYDNYHYACRCVYDDWDLILKIRNDGYKIVVLNEVLANFSFGGASNQKSLQKMAERMRERYRIYRENGYSRFYIVECIIWEIAKYLIA